MAKVTGIEAVFFRMKSTAFVMAMFLAMLLAGVASGQQSPSTGHAPINGLKLYYEIHGHDSRHADEPHVNDRPDGDDFLDGKSSKQ
jgi:hypothetical protein